MLAMMLVLAMADVASAALMVEVSAVPITFQGQDYFQFTVTAVGTDGDVLGAFDGRFDGPMNQLWPGGGGTPTPINSSPLGGPLTDIMPADQVAADTHLLLASIDLVVTGSSSAAEHLDMLSPETVLLPKVNPPQAFVGSVWGPGTWLAHSETNTMAFGIEAASRMTERPLAQLVVPLGESVQVVGIMADQAGLKYPVNMTLVPELDTFELSGSEHLDVSGQIYFRGELRGSSTANVLADGYIYEASVYDAGLLSIHRPSGLGVGVGRAFNTGAIAVYNGGVDRLYGYISSVLSVSGGSVSSLYAYDNTNVSVSGGSVSSLYAYDNSSVSVNAGSVSSLDAYDNSSVAISGGYVATLNADLRSLAGPSIDITGGTVSNLTLSVTLEGAEHLAISGSPTSLAPYGVTFAEGTVSNVSWVSVNARNASTVVVSDGSVSSLYAYDNSSVSVSGGTVAGLQAEATSTVEIRGGNVTNLHAQGDSSVSVSDGGVGVLNANHNTAVSLIGGTVDNLSAKGASTVDFRAGRVDTLDATNTSRTDIRGGAIYYLSVLDASTVIFHGYDFWTSAGLTLEGDDVIGTGILVGKWFDGTSWAVSIDAHGPGATILAIPEPVTLVLLSFGGLAVLRKRRG